MGVVRVRMSAIATVARWLTRYRVRRHGVPGPGHQKNERHGENHVGAYGSTEHVAAVWWAGRLAFLLETGRLTHPLQGDRMQA